VVDVDTTGDGVNADRDLMNHFLLLEQITIFCAGFALAGAS
jgi:hypothetical protein